MLFGNSIISLYSRLLTRLKVLHQQLSPNILASFPKNERSTSTEAWENTLFLFVTRFGDYWIVLFLDRDLTRGYLASIKGEGLNALAQASIGVLHQAQNKRGQKLLCISGPGVASNLRVNDWMRIFDAHLFHKSKHQLREIGMSPSQLVAHKQTKRFSMVHKEFDFKSTQTFLTKLFLNWEKVIHEEFDRVHTEYNSKHSNRLVPLDQHANTMPATIGQKRKVIDVRTQRSARLKKQKLVDQEETKSFEEDTSLKITRTISTGWLIAQQCNPTQLQGRSSSGTSIPDMYKLALFICPSEWMNFLSSSERPPLQKTIMRATWIRMVPNAENTYPLILGTAKYMEWNAQPTDSAIQHLFSAIRTQIQIQPHLVTRHYQTPIQIYIVSPENRTHPMLSQNFLYDSQFSLSSWIASLDDSKFDIHSKLDLDLIRLFLQ